MGRGIVSKRKKIGVFDSGFGGLTVLHELVRQVPHADYLYFGDTARLPYGSKSPETVARYAISATNFLRRHGAEMMVIACNTATALALPQIDQGVDVPVVGVVEPGAQAALKLSQSRKVAVIATEATVASHAYRRALEHLGLHAREQACPLLVPLIEEGWVDHAVTAQVAHIYMDQLFKEDDATDVLVLGCTHYPLIRPLLRKIVPERVHIVDSAESTAAAVKKTLGAEAGGDAGELHFFATDSVEKFQRLGAMFMGRPLRGVEHVDLEKL